MPGQGLDNRAGIVHQIHGPQVNKKFEDTEPEPEINLNTSTILVFCNLPKVDSKKYEKFINKVLKKNLRAVSLPGGKNIDWEDDIIQFYMPIGDEAQDINIEEPPKGKKTEGVCFIEFRNQMTAMTVLNELDGTAITKKNKIQIYTWKDFMKLEEYEENFEQPSFASFEASNFERAWLEDAEGRDQFLIRFKEGDDHQTCVYWGDHLRGGADLSTDFSRILSKKGQKCCLTSKEASWSPQGTFLTTLHGPGLKVWKQDRTGEFATKIERMEHRDVDMIHWSPNENYLVSFNSDPDDDEEATIKFWDIATGEKIKERTDMFAEHISMEWPFLQYSHDDKYFNFLESSKWKPRKPDFNPDVVNRSHADLLRIYDSKTFKKVAKINVPGIKERKFSPCSNLMAYICSTPQDENTPTTVFVCDVPGVNTLTKASHYQVRRAFLQWHPKGTHLCVSFVVKKKIRKKKGKKKDPRTIDPQKQIEKINLSICDCTNKKFPWVQVPIGKERLLACEFEPTESRLCVLQQGELKGENFVKFIDLKHPDREPIAMKVGDVCDVLWSPIGRHIVFAHENGHRTFHDTAAVVKEKKREHDSAEDLYWSPCGRFCVSTVTSKIEQDEDAPAATDNAWVMFNFQGEEIARREFKGTKMDKKMLFSFQWRPRPKSLVGDKEKEEIKRNILEDTKLWKSYEKADQKILRERLDKKMKDRLDKWQDWQDRCDAMLEFAQSIQKDREDLRDGRESEAEEEFDFIEEREEEIISQVEKEVTEEEIREKIQN